MPTTPRSAADYYRRQQRVIATLLLAVRRTWRRMQPTGSWQQQYDDGIGAQLLMLVSAAQVAAVRDADSYMADVLNELAFGPETQPGVLAPRGFVGFAGDGRPVETLLALSVAQAGQRYNRLQQAAIEPTEGDLVLPPRGSVDPETFDSLRRSNEQRLASARELTAQQLGAQALEETNSWLTGVVATAVIDTARAAESAAMVSRPWVGGYVRMLNPPSCSRCAVLAGAFYRWNAGFQRHPSCDCRHIPSAEGMAGDLAVNPKDYFESLPSAEELQRLHPDLTVEMRRQAGLYSQEDIFTKSGARAIRDGADVRQVVNARRGMAKAQVGGRDVLVSRESTTRRGLASRRRTGRNMQARLMPESIYEHARDREDAIRLLRLHGYIL